MRRSNAKRPEKMEPLKLQMRPNVAARAQKNAARSNLSVLILLASTIAAFLFLLVFVFNSRNPIKRGKKYGIVIDGGSTGTRIHVFSFVLDGEGRPVFDFGKNGLGAMRVSPGLSSYAEDPNRAGGSLVELLEFGKSRVPKEHWGDTEIRLMATAGLRRLELRVQEAILDSCRRVLRVSGFRFRDSWASVIAGSDEGMYAWVVANHALGSLGGDPWETTGIIELGGASAQITFVSREPVPPEFSHTLRFGNVSYNLYSHSLLHFGQNVALESLQKSLISRDLMAAESLQKGILIDPCTPKGYSLDGKNEYLSAIHAQGNFSLCRAASITLLQEGKETCSHQHCLGSTFMPKLQGKFLATENFFHTSKFFGLGQRAFLSGLMVAGQHFCGEDWSELKKKYYLSNEEDLLHYCFSSAYIVAFLHDSLGIALDDERLGYANQMGDIPLDWALGAFILQSTANLEAEEHSDWITTVVSDESPTLPSLLVILIILLFTVWSISKCKKPQLKTIYDLEKGRYIVTRINRCS